MDLLSNSQKYPEFGGCHNFGMDTLFFILKKKVESALTQTQLNLNYGAVTSTIITFRMQAVNFQQVTSLTESSFGS